MGNNIMYDLYSKLGVVGCVLILLCVFMLSLLILKILQFTILKTWRNINFTLGDKQIDKSTCQNLIQNFSKSKNPVKQVLKTLLNLKYIENKSDDYVQTEVKRIGSKYLNQLEEYLRPIEVISHLAPLIGLLGTVLGIIMAFSAIKSVSHVDPGMLSSGISHALLTTALGLVVAIPAQISFHFFDSKVEKIRESLNDHVAWFSQITVI
jgi:biopolymer transport protein ExbB